MTLGQCCDPLLSARCFAHPAPRTARRHDCVSASSTAVPSSQAVVLLCAHAREPELQRARADCQTLPQGYDAVLTLLRAKEDPCCLLFDGLRPERLQHLRVRSPEDAL